MILMIKSSKSLLKISIKIIISLSLLIYLFLIMDVGNTILFLKKTRLLPFFLGLSLYLVGQIVCTYRWQIISRLLEFRKGFFNMVSYYFVGMFFNLFLPSIVGGDIGKAMLLAEKKERWLPATYSVLSERFFGIIGLLFILNLAIILPPSNYLLSPSLRYGIHGGSFIFFLILPFLPKLSKRFLRFFNRFPLRLADLSVFWSHPQKIYGVIGLSLINQVLVVAVHILLGSSLNLKISWEYYFSIVPLVGMISMLPISLNGMGVREGLYVYFLSLYGIGKEPSLAFAIVWFILLLFSGIIGGGVYLLFQNRYLSLIRGNDSVDSLLSCQSLEGLEKGGREQEKLPQKKGSSFFLGSRPFFLQRRS